MVVIRLARGGTKKRAFYHVVVSNSREARDGRYIEKLGFYNPIAAGEEIKIQLNQDRIDYWLSKGAQPSERVKYLMDNFAEIAAGTLKKKPKPKKAKKVKEEKPVEEPKAEEKPAEEKPVEEPKVEEKPAEEPKVEEKKPEEKPVEEKPAEEPKPEEKPETEEPKKEEPASEAEKPETEEPKKPEPEEKPE